MFESIERDIFMYTKPLQEIEKIANIILITRRKYIGKKISYYDMAEICCEKGTDPDVIIYFLTTDLNLTSHEIEMITLILPNKWGSDNEWENPVYKQALFKLKDNIDLIIPTCRQKIKSRINDWIKDA